MFIILNFANGKMIFYYFYYIFRYFDCVKLYDCVRNLNNYQTSYFQRDPIGFCFSLNFFRVFVCYLLTIEVLMRQIEKKTYFFSTCRQKEWFFLYFVFDLLIYIFLRKIVAKAYNERENVSQMKSML